MMSPALTAAALLEDIDPSDAGVVRLFERVRDIPCSFAAHSDAETLLACGFGTCAPKHALLARLYAQLGLETRFSSCVVRTGGWTSTSPSIGRSPRPASS